MYEKNPPLLLLTFLLDLVRCDIAGMLKKIHISYRNGQAGF